jgi:hypothetical protein
MLVLALLLQIIGASPPGGEESPRHAAEQDCWGGRILWFQHGTDLLDPESVEVLRHWSRAVRDSKVNGHIELEASADGTGPTFNRDLSLRRTSQLKRLLRENGLGRLEVEARNTSFSTRRPDPDPEVEREKGQYAHVRLMVRYASEFIAPGLHRECR